MTTETKYRSAATQLLEQARRELDAGDIRQASEKGWRAAAQAVKAVAERRGWKHDTEADIFNVVSRLVDETGNENLASLILVAGSLEMNSHENCQPTGMVRVGLDQVAEFVALMADVE